VSLCESLTVWDGKENHLSTNMYIFSCKIKICRPTCTYFLIPKVYFVKSTGKTRQCRGKHCFSRSAFSIYIVGIFICCFKLCRKREKCSMCEYTITARQKGLPSFTFFQRCSHFLTFSILTWLRKVLTRPSNVHS